MGGRPSEGTDKDRRLKENKSGRKATKSQPKTQPQPSKGKSK